MGRNFALAVAISAEAWFFPVMTLVVPNHLKRGGVIDGSAESGLDGFEVIARALGADLSWFDGKSMLDMGCGNRLAEAVIAYSLPLKRYAGLDNAKRLIDVMAPQTVGTNVEMVLIPVFNARYAADAPDSLSRDYELPVQGTFDLIHAWSLFSHLNADDADAYFHVLRRYAHDRTAFIFTTFLEDIQTWRDDSDPSGPPLLRARYGPDFLDSLLTAAGWRVHRAFIKGDVEAPWPRSDFSELTSSPGGQSCILAYPA